jgi:DNA-directed RNA polymerase subunit N
MLIPIRCFTCGKLLADKKKYYDKELLRKKLNSNEENQDEQLILNLNIEDVKKTVAGETMDELGLIRLCCRKTMLSNVDLIKEI